MISSNEKTRKLNIDVKEHEVFNSGILNLSGSTVDYDILIWDNKSQIIAKKIGKVGRKNLSKSLSFDVPDLTDLTVHFSLSLSVTIDGKKSSFITVSQDNDSLSGYIKELVNNGQEPGIFTSFTFTENSSPHNMTIFTIEESLFEEAFLKSLGSKTIILDEELSNIDSTILEAERAIRKLALVKKESLGVNVILNEELTLIDFINKSPLFDMLEKTIRIYEATGTLEISEQRQKLYANLKPVLDNLVIARGRLEKITENLKKSGEEAVRPFPGEKI